MKSSRQSIITLTFLNFLTFLTDIFVILILKAMELDRTALKKEMLSMYCKFFILEKN